MLAKHIHNLLAQESAVIIPGLGRLYAQYESSTIRGAELLPPQRNILFDDVADTDPENKLARFVARQGEDGETAAASRIEDFVAEIKSGLEEKQRYEVPALGTFTEKSGRISFESANMLRESPQAFGLSPLSLKPVVSSQKQEPAASPPEPEEANQPEPEPQAAPPVYTKKDMEKPKKTGSNNELITWLVIIPLVFVFAFLVWLFVQRGSSDVGGEEVSEAPPPVETVTEEELPEPQTPPIEEPEELPETETAEAPEKEEIPEETEPDTPPAAPDPEPTEQPREPSVTDDAGMLTEKTGQYYLVVFSSDNRTKAQEMRQQLLGEGQDAYLMPHDSREGWVRVAVGGYASTQEALDARAALSDYQSWVKKW